jgi:hypothetical protein
MAMEGSGSDLKRDWVIRVLGVDPLAPLQASRENDDAGSDDEVDAGTLGGDDYHAYLSRVLKRLHSTGQGSFAIAIGKRATDHRMAMSPTKSPKALATKLSSTTGLHQVAWGKAQPSEERALTIELNLESRLIPGLKKRGEQMLRAHKPLPFAKIALHANGEALDDMPADDDLFAADEEAEDRDMGDDPTEAELPEPPLQLSPQALAFQSASLDGVALVEVCPLPSGRRATEAR